MSFSVEVKNLRKLFGKYEAVSGLIIFITVILQLYAALLYPRIVT
ncbi:hypothetical protein SAMN02745195_01363 [Thermoanaerobacter uzonensis DSM 18761]|uniref:Uncharacterized protein n=1 Tax=Thermoanaerobacter uzonensis DSM 18761 TaxID=1123369 RepID=A0A1M4X0J3_9THEO|nr:hypothetical protein SAMN02745195_01363 [Thermoanaerobacter uzonensis DSM 18761]